ncbi:FAD-dependent oxidoreductase [Oryzomonas rubra]|uniref:FAD-dependent oxidoreductase n=1 Tax=Oryzomonas rubra TaxID=2509454 RepID=A0A5A9XNW8_9BACT|nr:FAD-dependent oxidoreductase [Oryzomonas rubra]KAA0894293.1 FAD-dependent oxidoreductase [Oryzomonas rubra]
MKSRSVLRGLLVAVALLTAGTVCSAADKAAVTDYDVVVVGGGGSGACAALAAAQSGAKVLVVEKERILSGSSALTKGMMGINTSLQRQHNMKITPMEVFKQMESYTHLLFNARLARTAVEHSGETIEWLMANGVKLWLPVEPQQFAHDAVKPIIYHMWDGHQGMAALTQAIEKAGGTIMYRTEATKLTMNPDGSVGGVQVRSLDGAVTTINAKAVIIATGGFMGNDEMMKKAGIVGHPMGWLANDGVGMKMAWEAGAAKYKENVTEYHGQGIVTKGNNKESILMTKLEPFIHIPILWVDKTGQRYYNEDYVYDNALVSHALVSIGGQGFVVFDQATVDKFKKAKTGMTDSFANIRNIAGKQSGPIPQLDQYLEAGVKEGVVHKGRTLEELAANAGFQKEPFLKQIGDYNGYVKKGDDEQFGKAKEHLMYTVAKGPFYALEVMTYNLTTIGGIKVNEHLEAVDENANPVKGLYAVGNVAGGLYSDSYMTVEGLTMGFATISGRLAGLNSAAYVKARK